MDASALMLECIRIAHTHAKTHEQVLEIAAAYHSAVLSADKAEKPRQTLTAGKTANAEAGAKR